MELTIWLPLAAVFGAIFGRWIVLEAQQQKIKLERRNIFSLLIGDEITKRWQEHIGKDLKELFSTGEDIAAIRSFCNETTISDTDFPIFRMVYDKAIDLNVFGSSIVLSHLIYVYLLVRDLCDAQAFLTKLLKKFDNDIGEKREEIERAIFYNWSQLQDLVKRMDIEMAFIYSVIEKHHKKAEKKRDKLIEKFMQTKP